MNDEAPAAGSSFTRAETEAGRKLFAGDWQFAWAAGSIEVLPPMRGVEIAFAGRSNVGKSRLVIHDDVTLMAKHRSRRGHFFLE